MQLYLHKLLFAGGFSVSCAPSGGYSIMYGNQRVLVFAARPVLPGCNTAPIGPKARMAQSPACKKRRTGARRFTERRLPEMLTPPERKKPGPLKTALMTIGMMLLLILIGYFFGGK